eukprot:TRINITY_DN20445_c0_g2_i1.p1 TRINITY_DN20445_c0_g2~~TRINITY_DN20445_c0_g2_i1.p1  ORF type:complete len:476 (-),score=97.18 TRINITY_DN20445_c0_g2_i1:112-1401(-)
MSKSDAHRSNQRRAPLDAAERTAVSALEYCQACCLKSEDLLFACLENAFQERRSPAAAAARASTPATASSGAFTTTLRKLRHDYEMLQHLEDRKLLVLPEAAERLQIPTAMFYHSLFVAASQGREEKPDKAFEVRLPLDDPRRELFASLHNTALPVPRPLLGEELKLSTFLQGSRSAKSRFLAAEGSLREKGYAVLDGILSKNALKAFQRHLTQASVYYYHKYGGSYLLGLFEDGLATPLLKIFMEALRTSLPKVFAHLRLCEAKAWKADNVASEVLRPAAGIDGSEGNRGSSDVGGGAVGSSNGGSAAVAAAASDRAAAASGHGGSASADETQRVPSPGLESQGSTLALLLWVIPRRSLLSQDAVPISFKQPNGTLLSVEYAANRAILWRDDCEGVSPSWHGVKFRPGYIHRGIHFVLRFQEVSTIPE